MVAAGMLLAGTVHAAAPAAATRKNLTPAVKQYLRQKGDFCLGKFEWPIAVSDADRQVGTHDAIQMPALEKLGLVSVADAPGDSTIKEYSLTAAGQKYYRAKQTITVNSAGQKIKHRGDFCPARLDLDKVVSWDPLTVVDGRTQTTVTYTYRIGSAADWARDPDIRKVFPMIPKILDNAGSQKLTQLFAWSGHGWVPVLPGD